jgi:hypothetical protein
MLLNCLTGSWVVFNQVIFVNEVHVKTIASSKVSSSIALIKPFEHIFLQH